MFIFRSLGLKCVPFLPHILPHFLYVMRHGEESLRDVLFQQVYYIAIYIAYIV